MTSSDVGGERQTTVLILNLPDDRKDACQLRDLLVKESFRCDVFSESSGANVLLEMFRLSRTADCVIFMITRNLLVNKEYLEHYPKVCSMRNWKRFIPVVTDVPNACIDNRDEFGFLLGYSRLRVRWDDDDFRQSLVNMIRAEVRVRPQLGPVSSAEISNEIKPEEPSAEKPTDDDDITAPNTSCSVSGKVNIIYSNANVKDCTPESKPVAVEKNVIVSSVQDCETSTNLGINLLEDKYDLPEQVCSNSPSHKPIERLSVPDHISIPVQEENQNKFLGKGSSGEVYLCEYTLPSGEVIKAAQKILHTHDRASGYFNREKALKPITSPFLLPILNVKDDRPRSRLQIFTPYMENGNLEDFLKSKGSTFMTKETDLRQQYMVIAYQVIAATDKLHENHIVHGDINPCNILLDEYWNARLGDYGLSISMCDADNEEKESDSKFRARVGYADPYAKDPSAKSFAADIFSLGITLLQILKWGPSSDWVTVSDGGPIKENKTLFDCLWAKYERKLPTAQTLLGDKDYVDDEIWKDDKISLRFVDAVLKCLTDDETRVKSLSDMLEMLKTTLTNMGSSLITFPIERCVYCFVGKPRKEHCPKMACSQSCVFTKICDQCCISIPNSGPIICPLHGKEIHPKIGGRNAYALIIHGRDTSDQAMQLNFLEDAKAIERVVEHPRILAVPRQNIFRISPDENNDSGKIVQLIDKIVAAKPDFFLMYYSGHRSSLTDSKLDVSDSQGQSLDIDKLKGSLINRLWECPRILVVLDCCYAASLRLLPDTQNTSDSDSHILWHIQLSSCGRSEESNIEQKDVCSVFTKFFAAGLQGALKCPTNLSDCQLCTRFREICRAKHHISVTDIRDYVSSHVNTRVREGRDDIQRPLSRAIQRDEAILAHFTELSLYRFNFESPSDPGPPKQLCIDKIFENTDDILESLWNTLKANKWISEYLDHRALTICKNSGKKPPVSLSTIDDIVNSLHDDDNSLYVCIRKNGGELDVGKWVACFHNSKVVEVIVEHSFDRCSLNVCDKSSNSSTVWQLRKCRDDSDFPDKGFGLVLRQSWEKFCSLKATRRPNDLDHLRVELRSDLQLQMLSIATSTIIDVP